MSDYNRHRPIRARPSRKKSTRYKDWLLIAITLVLFQSSVEACISRLASDGQTQDRIFVRSDSDADLQWVWHMEDGGSNSYLSTPMISSHSLEFAVNYNDPSWSSDISVCEGYAFSSMQHMDVSFHRIEPSGPTTEESLAFMQQGIDQSNPHEVKWTQDSTKVGLEQAGTWLVQIQDRSDNRKHSPLLFLFELVILAPCSLSKPVAFAGATYAWPTTTSVKWLEKDPSDALMSQSCNSMALKSEASEAVFLSADN